VGEGNLFGLVDKPYKRRKRKTAREGCKTKMSTETKKVNLELEIDTSTVDSSKNKYQGLIDMARAVDAWRIFPRLFLTVYIVLLYKCVIWYMNLGAPTMEQSGLISIVVGAGAAWFGLYTGTSKSKK
jgi:hypothetical protein